jgi:hypothetical protein
VVSGNYFGLRCRCQFLYFASPHIEEQADEQRQHDGRDDVEVLQGGRSHFQADAAPLLGGFTAGRSGLQLLRGIAGGRYQLADGRQTTGLPP